MWVFYNNPHFSTPATFSFNRKLLHAQFYKLLLGNLFDL